MGSEIASEFLPFGRIYKDGRVERLTGTEIIPTSLDATNEVVSKDVVYSPNHNLSVRIFLPHKSTQLAAGDNKLPLLIYIHGGAWIIESPFSPIYHNYLTEVVKSANCLGVSIQYRRAPEHPIPAAYEDTWSAIQWIYSHSDGSGPEEWINKHADFGRVFVGGDSAGANMSHHMAMRAGKEKVDPKIKGIAIVHPAFWGTDPVDEHDVQDRDTRSGIAEVWEKIASPNSVKGTDDPLFNVVGSDSDLSGLGCEKALVAVAGKDVFVRQGLGYAAKLKKSGWKGDVEVVVEEVKDGGEDGSDDDEEEEVDGSEGDDDEEEEDDDDDDEVQVLQSLGGPPVQSAEDEDEEGDDDGNGDDDGDDDDDDDDDDDEEDEDGEDEEDLGTEYLVRPVGRAEDEEDASDFEPEENGVEEDIDEGEDDVNDDNSGAGKSEAPPKRKRGAAEEDEDEDSDDEDDERPPKR